MYNPVIRRLNIALPRATAAFLLMALSLLASCGGGPRPSQQVSDAEVNFSERRTYALTGGDTEEAGLSGFQRDSFRAFFTGAVNEILNRRGLTEVTDSRSDSADYIIRYILRDKLIITALDPKSRRLIWRGQSDDGLPGGGLSQAAVSKLVKQAISGFPPR